MIDLGTSAQIESTAGPHVPLLPPSRWWTPGQESSGRHGSSGGGFGPGPALTPISISRQQSLSVGIMNGQTN